MRRQASSPSNDPDESGRPKRDSHGQRRGLPPPAEFDFEALPDGQLLTEFETGAIIRQSTNTLGAWRRLPDHPLRWIVLPNGFVRYQVRDIRRYLASGTPRPPRRRARAADAAAQERDEQRT